MAKTTKKRTAPAKKAAKKTSPKAASKATADFSYTKNYLESLSLLFKNPKVFVPFVVMVVLSFLLIPVYGMVDFTNPASFGVGFVLLMLVLAVISIIIYGWQFVLCGNVAQEKGLDLKSAFSDGLPVAWRYFKLGLVSLVWFIAAYAIYFLLLGLFSLLGTVLQGIYVFIGTIALFLAILVLMAAVLQAIPLITFLDEGVWKLMLSSIKYVLNNKWTSFKKIFVVFVAGLIASIPAMVYMFATIGFSAFASGDPSAFYSTGYMVANTLLNLPVMVAYLAAFVAYMKAYLVKK